MRSTVLLLGLFAGLAIPGITLAQDLPAAVRVRIDAILAENVQSSR
jgi:hypothetical protein